jgi:hypothetical protein
MTLRLPHATAAIIDRGKITDHLLATAHPAGRAKAAFFAHFGFSIAHWQRLRDALFDHAQSAPVVAAADTPFGKKYILEGPLAAPDRRSPRVQAVWFIEIGERVPKFVTAYPLPGAER